MSRMPLLGGDNDDTNDNNAGNIRGTLRGAYRKLFRGDSNRDWIPFAAIYLLVNAEDPEERDELTRNWRNHKIQELSFVGTTGALLAACLASTGSWPDILPDGRNKPWQVRAAWHSGLIFALFAVIVCCQQSMRLHSLSAHRDGLKFIRASLAKRKGLNHSQPTMLQVYAWQASWLFLVGSLVCGIAGLTALVWLEAVREKDEVLGNAVLTSSLKMAITLTISLGLSIVVFFISQEAMTAIHPEE